LGVDVETVESWQPVISHSLVHYT